MRDRYFCLLSSFFVSTLLLLGLGTRDAHAQSNCTSPNLGESGPEVCVTIYQTGGGPVTPVTLRAPADVGDPPLAIVGPYGEYELDLTVAYSFDGLGMAIQIDGTVERIVPGTQGILIDAEGGWGTPLPGGGGSINLAGFATGAAGIESGGAVGFPFGTVPAEDVAYTGLLVTCAEVVYGPRPPGNVGEFDCSKTELPVADGGVAIKNITVVNIIDVGEIVDLPSGTGAGDPPSRGDGDDINGSATVMVNPDGTWEIWFQGRFNGTTLSFMDAELHFIVPLLWFGYGPGLVLLACYAGPPAWGCFFGPVGQGDTYEIHWQGQLPPGVNILEGHIQINKNPGGEDSSIPIRLVRPGTPGSISGVKYEDLNRNGMRDELEPGVFEPPVEGWIISLDGVPSATTDSDGKYTISNVEPGEHMVSEEDRSPQWRNSTPSESTVTMTDGSETKDVDFGNYRTGDIVIWKFEDLNGNGEHDEGEPFLEGWDFWLDENDNGEMDAGEESITTDSQGGGEFTGLDPGTHVVRENIASQSGWETMEARKEVELESGQTIVSETAPELFFANYRPGDIIVYKFNDKNENGAKDDGEEFIEGWTVSVDGVEKTTDENGEARFEDLPPKTYDVAEVVQDGWENTTGNNPTTVELESGESIENETPEKVWFGNKAKGVVIVRKFHDRNGDGDRDDGEEFLEGWEMTVDGETKTTDSNGEARFEDFPPGMYGVSETKQDGWKPSIPNPSTVEVPAGETVTFDFGNYHPGEIHGTKYLDVNGDGNVDAPQDTPLVGWKITCSGGPSCTPAKSVFTDATGRYWFLDLKPGTYTVTETVQAGWRATTPASIAGIVIVSTDDSSNRIEDQDFHNQPTGDPGDGADFGDAPEAEDPERPQFPTGYPTLLANNGAVHVIDPEVRIGDLIDAELDGQPTIPADGDDEDVPLDDEDGIEFFSDFVMLSLKLDPGSDEETVVPGQITGTTGEIVVYPSTTGILDAWVDWNRDGDWADDGERIYDGEIVSPLSDTLDWPVPSNAVVGYTYARFRFTLGGATSYDGAEPIGEIEDYLLYTLAEEELSSADDTEDVNPGDGLCADFAGNCTVRAAIMEANASGVPWLVSANALGKSGRAILQPQSPYPMITGSLLLDGAGTLEIDGSQAGAGANGFVLAGGSWIVATHIHSFDGDGLRMQGDNNVAFDDQIRNNGGAGVNVVSGSGNVIRTNAIFDNGALGIDLGADGVTNNDIDDSDAGANDLQNYPTLSVVTAENAHIEGNLTSTPDTDFAIDFFASPTCDASGFGEGQTYVGSVEVTTDNLGSADFSVSVSENTIAVGEAVTATATATAAGGEGNTSEFSGCFFAVSTDIERIPDVELPNDYELFQNYPNPFNPVTNIRFAITSREWVTLEVYDILGKRVATLVDGYVEAGEFTVAFDASDLPSGIYIYRMTAGLFTTAKQLTLLK